MIVNTSLKNNLKTLIFLILSSCASYSNKEMQKNVDLNKVHDPLELMKIGDKYYEKSQLEPSIEAYKLAILKLRGTGEENKLGLAHNSLGMCYQTQNNYEEAMKCYETATFMFNQNKNLAAMADVTHNIGTLKYLQHNFQASAESYKSVLKLFDRLFISGNKRFESEYFLAQAYEKLGMIIYAKKIYEKLISIEAHHKNLDIAQTLYNLAIRFCIRNQYSKAMECYEKVFVMHKKDNDLVGMAKILYSIGILEYNQKNFEKAIQCYKEVLKIFGYLSVSRPVQANIEYNLVVAYAKKGDFLSAKELCKELVSIEAYAKKALEMLKNLDRKISRMNHKIVDNRRDINAFDVTLNTQKKYLELKKTNMAEVNLLLSKTLATRNDKKVSQHFNIVTKKKVLSKRKSKSFVCNYCNKKFNKKYNLLVHERIHTRERPFKCDVCARAFAHSHSLVDHKRIHTGEKPYECHICYKRFTAKHNLKIHHSIHTGEKPYSCKNCQRKFRIKSGLNSHVRNMHSFINKSMDKIQ